MDVCLKGDDCPALMRHLTLALRVLLDLAVLLGGLYEQHGDVFYIACVTSRSKNFANNFSLEHALELKYDFS